MHDKTNKHHRLLLLFRNGNISEITNDTITPVSFKGESDYHIDSILDKPLIKSVVETPLFMIVKSKLEDDLLYFASFGLKSEEIRVYKIKEIAAMDCHYF